MLKVQYIYIVLQFEVPKITLLSNIYFLNMHLLIILSYLVLKYGLKLKSAFNKPKNYFQFM